MFGVGRRRLASSLLILVGVFLLANPAWISSLTVYPGTSWAFLPLFHAAFSALGVLTTTIGVLTFRREPRLHSLRFVGAVGVGTILIVPLYGSFMAVTTNPQGPTLSGYGLRRALVASLVVGVFVVGWGLERRHTSTVLLGLFLPTVPFVLAAAEWRSGALLEPILELYFLLAGGPILGLRYLGSVLFVVTFVFGLAFGLMEREDDIDTPSEEAESADT